MKEEYEDLLSIFNRNRRFSNKSSTVPKQGKREPTSSDNAPNSVTSSGSGLNRLIPKSFKPGNVIFPGNTNNDTYTSPRKKVDVENIENDSSLDLTPIVDQSKSTSALDVS